MIFLTFLPALVRRRPGRVELTVPALVRGGYLALGAAFVYLMSRSLGGSNPITWLFTVIIALASLSEDRWIFDAESREMRRRFGLLLAAKSWALDLDGISSFELDSDAWETASADPTETLPGAMRKGWCALRVILSDGRSVMLSAQPGKRLAALRNLGLAVAETLGKPFEEN